MRLIALLLLGVAWALAPTRADAANVGDLAILVAPFEVVAPPGAPIPDVALLLADRLGTKGLGRVVGPSALAIEPVAEPSPEVVQGWSGQSETDLVVVGRATRLGRRISLDLRVRSGQDGSVLGTYVAEAARPEDVGSAVEELASDIVASAEAADIGGARPPAAVSAAPVGTDRGESAGSQGGTMEDGMGAAPPDSSGSAASSDPLSIQSEEMEALQTGDGTRRFLFRRNVRLVQGDMRVFSDRMEAFYPSGTNGGPNRMVATGSVRLRQSGRKAKCERATVYTRERRVVCEGRDAELVQGTDRVRGREIEFFLDTNRMLVRGGADVFLEPGEAPVVAEPAPELAGEGSE